MVKGTPAIISSLPQQVFAPGKQQTPQADCFVGSATAARSGAGCTSLPWHFKIFPDSGNEFRLFQTVFTAANETSWDNTSMLFFDQDHVNCSGCLHLKVAIYDMGAQGVWNQGEGSFLCSTTCPPFLQSVPLCKGI